MKKVTLLLFVLQVVFISCSENNDIEILPVYPLENTTWVYYDKQEYYEQSFTLKFQKSTFTLDYLGVSPFNIEAPQIMSFAGTYIYEHPTIVIDYTIRKEVLTLFGEELHMFEDSNAHLIMYKQ